MKPLFAALAALFLSVTAALAEIDIKEVKSPSGLTAWLVEDHSIPFVALEIRFRGGASLDEPGKRGATYLMTGLLEEGAADMDAQEFARATETLAASFGYDVSDDELSISARFLTENRDEAIGLLRASIKEPRFDEDAIERVRRQILSGIASDANDPNDIAGRVLDGLIFGEHPYATSYKGTAESVAALTRENMVTAHRNIFARDRIYVGAAGDITAEELGALVDTLLADLPETGAPLPDDADVTIPGGVTVVPFETPQSVALFVQPGIGMDDPDFFPAFILNQIIGAGGFESRLMDEVRKKRGLTYGIYSYLVPKDYAHVWMGSVASANDRIAETIAVIREEWESAANDGVSATEVEAAKKYLTGAYPLRFDGNGAIANILAGMQIQGLPIDYIASRNDKVRAVTLDEVNELAARLMDPEGLHFVVVGQPEGLEASAAN